MWQAGVITFESQGDHNAGGKVDRFHRLFGKVLEVLPFQTAKAWRNPSAALIT